MRPTRSITVLGTVIDAALAALVLAAAVTELLAWWTRRWGRSRSDEHVLLLIDAAYSLDTVGRRAIEHALTSQDLDGYFTAVWHVHPLVGADPQETSPITAGPARETPLAARHRVIEGHPAMWRSTRFPLTGFALAQGHLLHRLHRVIATHGVDVVRVGDPYYLGLIGLVLARAHRVPLAVRINGNYDAIYAELGQLAYPRLFRRRWVEKRIDRFVLKRAELVAGANENNLRFAIENGARPDRTAVFRYGALVDPAHLTDPSTRKTIRVELGLGERPYTVTVSRLEPVKRTSDVLHAIARLRSWHPDLAAVVIGDGAEHKALLRLARDLGIGDAVVFSGARDQEWIARALAGAALFLAPSAGRALVEAALAAVPLVTYDLDWHREFVSDGDNGYLVPAGDVDGLAGAAHRVLEDRQLGLRLGRRARNIALVTMDPAHLVRVQREAYDRVLGRPRDGHSGE